MHQRKALMEELSDAFVALPGGFGTLDELMEIVTWAQIGLHTKPIGLLNVEGYFDPLLAFVQRAVDDGFISPQLGSVLCVERTPEALLEKLLTHQPPAPAVQWIGPKKGAG
jgi:cytokinin riboside 5'-monophosphate phosphoribohydrolase